MNHFKTNFKHFKSKFILTIASSTVLLCAAPFVSAQFQDNKEVPVEDDNCLKLKKRKCKELVKRFKEQHCIPGIVVGVTVNGESVYKKGFGYSDIENNVKASGDTVMRIASISKPISSAIAAKLLENNLVKLDEPIYTHLKTIPVFKWNGEEVDITLRQLLSHTSGVRHYEKDVDLSDRKRGLGRHGHRDTILTEFYIKDHFDAVEDSLNLFLKDKLIFKPGTNYLYTTHGYTLASAVMEKAANRKYTDLLNDLFRYLQMNSTFLDENDPIIPKRSRYYKQNKNQLKNVPYVDISYKWAGGGLLSTVGDLLKFANHLLACYQTNKATNFLKQSTVRESIWAKQSSHKTKYLSDTDSLPIIKANEDIYYGLGWVLCFDQDQKLKYVYHNGGAMGCISCLMIKPEVQSNLVDDNQPRGIAVAIFCNSGDVSGIDKLALKITEIFSDSD